MSYGGSIASNPRVAIVDLTEHGSDWLWAAFAVMLTSALGMIVWSHSLGAGRRAFHYTASALLVTASVAYFCMASDLGGTPIVVEFVRNTSNTYTGNASPVTRSIWYVRYVDWAITTPLLLLTILLGTGTPTGDLLFVIFMDEVMIITGLVGALVSSQYKWGFYVFGCVAMFYVFWALVFPARRNAYALSPEAGKAYTGSAMILAFLWLLYPIAWGLSDGGNVISTDGEMVFYGVLDLLAKPVFTFWHMFQLRKVPYESFALASGHYSVGAAPRHTGDYEKQTLNGGAHHHTNGTAMSGPATTTDSTVSPTGTATGVQTHHPNVIAHHNQQPTGIAQQTAANAGVVQHTHEPVAAAPAATTA